MCLAVDAAPDDIEHAERYSAELEKLSGRDIALALFAVKLLSGRPDSVKTDNVERSKPIVELRIISAQCETCEDNGERTRLVFAPRPPQ